MSFKKMLIGLTAAVTMVLGVGVTTPTHAAQLHPTSSVAGCGDISFNYVYDARIGRSYAVGGKAWCGPSGYEWRAKVWCAQTLTGPSVTTWRGPWSRYGYSVVKCPTWAPYATNLWFEKRHL